MKIWLATLILAEAASAADGCVRCDKMLRLCDPECAADQTCVVTRQTCQACSTPHCIPNANVAEFCATHPVAVCLEPSSERSDTCRKCKKSLA